MSSHDDTMGSSHTEFLCNQFCASRRAHFGEEPRLTIAKVIVARLVGPTRRAQCEDKAGCSQSRGSGATFVAELARFLLFVLPFAESMSPSARFYSLNSWNSALASFRSAVSKPSVNQL